MIGLLLVAALVPALPRGGSVQDNPAPDPGAKWKIDFKLTLEEKDGEFVFVIAGATDIPPGALLRARVYAVEVVDDFRRGRREDEEPLVWEGDEEAGQPAFQNFKAAEGKFRVEVYHFRRRPWSLLYRARVHYVPRLQDDAEVLKRVGQNEFSRPADLRLGTPQTFAAELVERKKEATDDLVEINLLAKKLQEAFEARVKEPDMAAWKAWKDSWYSGIEKLAERNRERYGMWAVWFERQVKMRWGGMCELLRQLLVVCTEYFEGEAEALDRARKRMAGFWGYLEEAIDVCGIDFPLDTDKVGPAMEAYEKGLAPLRAWLETRDGDGAEIGREARRSCSLALFRITPHIRIRKRAYQYVNEMAGRLTRLVDLAGGKADGESLRKALAEHDAAVSEFRKFAGLTR